MNRLLLLSLVRDETGQDLIEYALLTTLIGLVGVIGINLFKTAINTTYTSWNSGVNSLWQTPDPM
jgi:Flp pilus assembly pilin Flp